MAKESDTIIVLHIPCTAHLSHCNSDYFAFHHQQKQSQNTGSSSEINSYRPPNPSLTRLTASMHKALHAASIQRREQILAHYRSLGYNVYCTDTRSKTSAIDAVTQASKLYSEHLGYAAEISEIFKWPVTTDSFARYVRCMYYCSDTNFCLLCIFPSCAYYQYNEQIRYLARDIISTALALDPDFLVLGADSVDIYNTLGVYHMDPRWSFTALPHLQRDHSAWLRRQIYSHVKQMHSIGRLQDFEEEDAIGNNTSNTNASSNGSSISLPPGYEKPLLNYAEERRKHFNHFLSYASSKATTIGMVLHELSRLNNWISGHINSSTVAHGTRTLWKDYLEREKSISNSNSSNLKLQPRFSLLLVNTTTSSQHN
jgi:hypothetical protein